MLLDFLLLIVTLLSSGDKKIMHFDSTYNHDFSEFKILS